MNTSYASSAEELSDSFAAFLSIAGLAFIFAFLIVCIIAVLVHYLEAIPTYIIAKKMGFRYAWVALLPIPLCTAYVLSSIPGKRDIKLLGMWSVKSLTAFIIYAVVPLIGSGVMTIIANILAFIPILGSFFAAIALFIPAVIMTIFEYEFLKDVLDIFSSDKKTNKITSIIVVVADFFLAIVKGIYLWTLIHKTPVEQPIVAEFTEQQV